jgi:hypothetical protein
MGLMHLPLPPVYWVQKYSDGTHWKRKRNRKKNEYTSCTIMTAQMMYLCRGTTAMRSRKTQIEAFNAIILVT